MVLSPERFLANVARVRSFVRVSPLVNQQVVAFGELPVAEPAYELFLGPRRPAEARATRTDGRGPRPGANRTVRGRTGSRGRIAEQRRRWLTAVLAARIQQERVRIAALVHDRLQHFVLVQRHGHQLILLLLVYQRNSRGRGSRRNVRRRRRRRLLLLLLLWLLLGFVFWHVHARRRLLLLLLLLER